MKIAFFHNLPSGGGKRSAFEWVKIMSKYHEVDLYLYNSNAEFFLDLKPLVNETFIIETGNVSGTGGFGRIISLHNANKASRKIAKVINNKNYELAFVMQCEVSNSPYLLRYLNIPSLYFCNEPLIKIFEPHCEGHWRKGILSPIKKFVINLIIKNDCKNAKYASLICANSLYSIENIYRNFGVYPRLNYCGVDIIKFHPMNLHREKQVLCVGSLTPAKGYDFVIRSVATIDENERPSIKFIYNSKYYRSNYQLELSMLASKLKVKIDFSNLVSDNDLVIAYNSSLVTACPNLLEPFGLVPIESMACATPVVGISEGGLRESINNNETGLLTERVEEEFGEAIKKIIMNPRLWHNMSKNGRQQVINDWTWEKSYNHLDNLMNLAVKIFKKNN
jgi:glycosyltransferase involved in cell wall biosynthesis